MSTVPATEIINMFNFLFKSKPTKAEIAAQWKETHTQHMVNLKYIKNALREQYARIRSEKIAALPPSKFQVGDTVRVVCDRENFNYGWVCLGHPFTVGQDEQGVVTRVDFDFSYLEEVLVEDYRNDSFDRQWERKHNRSLSINDVGTPEFINAINEFAKPIKVNYEYRIKFENDQIGIKWAVQEKFIDWPLGLQVA